MSNIWNKLYCISAVILFLFSSYAVSEDLIKSKQKISDINFIGNKLSPRFFHNFLMSDLQKKSKTNTNSNKYIKIVAVGDIMLGTNFPNEKHLPPDNGKKAFLPFKDIFNSADILFGNLEGVLMTKEGTAKQCSDPSICYAFKSPDEYINNFKDAGFDILSIANNHIGDFGEEGIANTVKLLNDAKINFAGVSSHPYCVFTKGKIKYGFSAFSPNKETLKPNDYEQATEIISHLDSLCDIVIVSMHIGAEGSKHTNITREDEYFLGDNRGNPYKFARVAIDAGADLIIGHGPHVVRAVDIYKDRFIAYSLGNFATYSRFNISGLSGLAPVLTVELEKNGAFRSGKITSAKQVGKGTPVLDYNNKVYKEIRKLTANDIPEAKLRFYENGIIRPMR